MSRPDAAFPPIADHGLIGDLRSCALVARDGTIDWFCPGRFDRASIFGSLLDPDAGSWTVEVVDGHTSTSQFYFPDTAILVTRFLSEDGVAEIHDFFPLSDCSVSGANPDHRQRIVRRIKAVRGRIRVRSALRARPGYGSVDPDVEAGEHGVRISGGDSSLLLTGSPDLEVEDGTVVADLTLRTGEEAWLALHVLASPDDDPVASPGSVGDLDVESAFAGTTNFWTTWLAQSRYTGRWREMVHRSAITLKLLTHQPSGAVVAAPTTSLPEEIGGERNWDYRYVWVRDAAFSIYALLRLGFTEEAAAFMRWLSIRMGERRCEDDDDLGPLRNLYDIDGGVPDEERLLEHLGGYRDSQPVRVGNAAVEQLQLDIYGELIDSVYLFNKYGPGISYDAWQDMTHILGWLSHHWQRDDAGMWEIRDTTRPHTTSRLMCWVAVERMIRMARQRGLPGDLSAWGEMRDAIYTRLMEESWDGKAGAFMAWEGAETVDAGVLLMPLVKFVAPNDPRWLSTLEVIEDRLVSDSLVFRYDLEETADGLEGPEGTFSMCSFWYVEALTRAGRLDDARLALQKMFTYANHLGLYAEEVGLTGEQLGNFPQAFTHLSLISAAINLDAALH